MEFAELSALADRHSAFISHDLSGRFWGLRLRDERRRPALTVGRNRSRLAIDGVDVHRRDLPLEDVVVFEGHRLTMPSRTAIDLSRTLPFESAVVLLDGVLNDRQVAEVDLRRMAAACRGRGAAAVRRAYAAADRRADSLPESLIRLWLTASPEVGTVVPQFRIGDTGHAYDFGLPELRILIEFQSWEHHGERRVWKRDAGFANAAMREHWVLLQLTWEDILAGADHVVAMVLDCR